MARIKKVLRRLLFLPVPLALFVVLLGAGGLWLVFGGVFPEGHPLSYLFYAFSAYALCVFIGLICRFYRSGRSRQSNRQQSSRLKMIGIENNG